MSNRLLDHRMETSWRLKTIEAFTERRDFFDKLIQVEIEALALIAPPKRSFWRRLFTKRAKE